MTPLLLVHLRRRDPETREDARMTVGIPRACHHECITVLPGVGGRGRRSRDEVLDGSGSAAIVTAYSGIDDGEVATSLPAVGLRGVTRAPVSVAGTSTTASRDKTLREERSKRLL
jgi:hypothetical protein